MKIKRNLMRLASLSVMLVALLAILSCGGGASGGGGCAGGDGGKDMLQEDKYLWVLCVSTDPAYTTQSFLI